MTLDLQQLTIAPARGERVDTARMLAVAELFVELLQQNYPPDRLAETLDIPASNDVSRLERSKELVAVWSFYPRAFIEVAFRYPPPWHLLVEPARWGVDATSVVEYLNAQITGRGQWPTIGQLRQHFGRASNHRPAADRMAGQERLG